MRTVALYTQEATIVGAGLQVSSESGAGILYECIAGLAKGM